MSWHRAVSVVGVITFGISLAVAPIAVTSASAHKAPKHHKGHHTNTPKTTGSASTTAAACTDLGGEQSASTQLTSKLGAAFASGNLTAIKQAVSADFGTFDKDLADVQAQLGSAPGNVKAAFATLSNAFKQLETSIQSATSLAQLEAAFSSLGGNPQLQSASVTLENYYDAKCGITPTTTTVP